MLFETYGWKSYGDEMRSRCVWKDKRTGGVSDGFWLVAIQDLGPHGITGIENNYRVYFDAPIDLVSQDRRSSVPVDIRAPSLEDAQAAAVQLWQEKYPGQELRMPRVEDYTPLKNVGKGAPTVAAPIEVTAWEVWSSGKKTYLFRNIPSMTAGSGPRNEYYLARLGPPNATGARVLTISAPNDEFREFIIRPPKGADPLAEADAVIIKLLSELKLNYDIQDLRCTVDSPPATETKEEVMPDKSDDLFKPTQTIVWDSVKNAVAGQVARRIEETAYRKLKTALIKKFPQLAIADNELVDRLVLFLGPVFMRHYLMGHKEKGIFNLKPEHVGWIITACDFTIQANAHKTADLMMEFMLPFLMDMADMGKDLMAAGDDPFEVAKLTQEWRKEEEALFEHAKEVQKEKVTIDR